jgi:hypothetical protein
MNKITQQSAPPSFFPFALGLQQSPLFCSLSREWASSGKIGGQAAAHSRAGATRSCGGGAECRCSRNWVCRSGRHHEARRWRLCALGNAKPRPCEEGHQGSSAVGDQRGTPPLHYATLCHCSTPPYARLLQFIETAERKAVEPYAPMLIHSVRTFVESLQQPEFLLPSVEVLVVLCQTQAQQFTPHFQVRASRPSIGIPIIILILSA